MLDLLLAPIVEVYRLALQPLAPFTWLGLRFSALDVAAAFRTCIALRQIKEQLHKQHVTKKAATQDASVPEVQERSFVRDLTAVLLVVFGGEAISAPALGIPASFMISGAGMGLWAAVQTIVDKLPAVHAPSFQTELPVSLLDGFTRAFLLCNLIPPMIVGHPTEAVATSPWSLLVTSLVTANGGFFIVNTMSFLQPYALTLTTPAEMLPWGWTTTDLWAAPFITGLYALLTHAQPFWADAHTVTLGWLGNSASEVAKVQPVDPEYARALCAVVLMGLFSKRVATNFGALKVKRVEGPKTKVQ
ncbi:uncharacterized protein C8Q71DRAFT_720352 [Rhodofomes roseus]|uniref:Uncharacterized protein n=1 Tax=Rhodofomes roseus TaxID=34475 RepID=A0ABQ8KV58_9APHY|nr:uncharacterized protein C8Q71DRAFT_720352 [Rhodofomes roseus]KAH9842957.1 hypothetical protein C8Q71DRAFT_720352 [Rhodofomes roseus]